MSDEERDPERDNPQSPLNYTTDLLLTEVGAYANHAGIIGMEHESLLDFFFVEPWSKDGHARSTHIARIIVPQSLIPRLAAMFNRHLANSTVASIEQTAPEDDSE